MAAWNYREIDILSRNGVEVRIYPTQMQMGPYMPKPEWYVGKPSVLKAVCAQPAAFLRSPGKYVRLLRLAVRMRTVPEFLLGQYFSLDMRKVGVQHIHCHFGDRKFFTGYYCHEMLGVPISVTVHAYEILGNPNPEMFKLAAKHCSKVVTISEFNKREINRVLGLPEEQIEVIHVHGDMADERRRTAIKILIVASFTEQKGHDILLRALKKLNRDDIVLWVVGDGEIDVRQMAKDEGVAGQTVFLGRIGEDLLKILYDACDIFVLPSRTASDGLREGVPVSIMEAMSHRKAVISTNHVGIPELVPEVIVEENDVEGLAAAIARLADSPDERARMGDVNYDIIKREFSDEAVMRLRDLFSSHS